jgi:putative membrane protein insertion efficiency factor
MNRLQATGIRLQALGFGLWAFGSRLPARFLLLMLRGYKFAVSPFFPLACRYVPTCSDYASEAIEIHGAVCGSALAIWRLLRCHPFVRGGYDPVLIKNVAPDALVRGPARFSPDGSYPGWADEASAPTRAPARSH